MHRKIENPAFVNGVKNLFKILYIFLMIISVTTLAFSAVYAYASYKNIKYKVKKENKKIAILTGKEIVFKSGCYTCHSFVKGKRYDGVKSLANWGDKGLSIKQTEKAIRSCKADVYCSQILTDKQVQYVAEYLNSLKTAPAQVGKSKQTLKK